MSDECSGKISGGAGDHPPVDPALFWRDDVRRLLTALDVGGLYRILGVDAGLSQRQIAARVGQSQSEVSEIVAGRRRVESHQVLVRIAESYDIPRELMGLSWWGPGGTYCGEVPVAEPPTGEGEAMRRRTLIATTMLAALGEVVQGLGELTELALPTGDPLPLRLSMSHVHAVEAVTERLRGVARQFGGQGGLFGVAAQYYARWMVVPASEVVKVRLGAALAELYTEAGWAYHDSGVDGMGCFTRALRLADTAGDGFGIANAAWHAGASLVRSGHPNDALKCFQLGQLVLTRFQPGKAKPSSLRADDPRIPILTARLSLNSATAYALMNIPDQAKRSLAEARDGWAPRDAFERAGMDRATAGIELDLRRFDIAESLAACAVRTYGEGHRRGRTMAEVMVAELHVRTGEPRGLVLARQAIEEVSTLQSVRVRQERLVPLIIALEARPGNDAKEIARIAHQVLATRV
ncbi:MAG TPA: helix-turn-helix transcriptional regulator [Pseudonocardiaceae bacterium]|nr:helix-turn-helix transcriptional regulator [Pseudonocardiaceae bacterium]